MTVHWMTFLISAVVIILAGVKLASFGNALGERSGLGQGWIGLLFLATITSIPELATTVTGAAIGIPNIAVGNALGSNLFNIAIIAIMDILLLGRGPFLGLVRPYHVTSGGLAVLLTVLAMLGMTIDPGAVIWGVSPISLLILLTYVAGVFLLYRIERRDQREEEKTSNETMPLGRAIGGFLICGGMIIASGIILVHASRDIAEATGLSASFMGAILVAIVTSLPELATSIGALKIKAYDMIIGNLMGSNMFNILTIFFADLAFRRGAIFGGLGEEGIADQLLVAGLGIAMITIATIAIAYRSKRRVFGIGVGSVLLLIGYIVSLYLIVNRGIHV